MAKIPDLNLTMKVNVEMPEVITINGDDGEVVWKGTRKAFGFLLAAMRSDLIREWRCWREDGSYGPPCTSQADALAHTWPHRHSECCSIVYYEQRNEFA